MRSVSLAASVVLGAACTSPPPPRVTAPTAETPTAPVAALEFPAAAPLVRRAVLRVDRDPSEKGFWGAWLELPDGSRWVIDYRRISLWNEFADREVVVTGNCYAPAMQSVRAPHFRVDHLKLATEARGVAAYVTVGPVITLRGTFVTTVAPSGSKAEGTITLDFRAEDGTVYHALGPERRSATGGGVVTVRGRVLQPDMSFMQRTGGPDLWIDAIGGPRTAALGSASEPRAIECP